MILAVLESVMAREKGLAPSNGHQPVTAQGQGGRGGLHQNPFEAKNPRTLRKSEGYSSKIAPNLSQLRKMGQWTGPLVVMAGRFEQPDQDGHPQPRQQGQRELEAVVGMELEFRQ